MKDDKVCRTAKDACCSARLGFVDSPRQNSGQNKKKQAVVNKFCEGMEGYSSENQYYEGQAGADQSTWQAQQYSQEQYAMNYANYQQHGGWQQQDGAQAAQTQANGHPVGCRCPVCMASYGVQPAVMQAAMMQPAAMVGASVPMQALAAMQALANLQAAQFAFKQQQAAQSMQGQHGNVPFQQDGSQGWAGMHAAGMHPQAFPPQPGAQASPFAMHAAHAHPHGHVRDRVKHRPPAPTVSVAGKHSLAAVQRRLGIFVLPALVEVPRSSPS